MSDKLKNLAAAIAALKLCRQDNKDDNTTDDFGYDGLKYTIKNLQSQLATAWTAAQMVSDGTITEWMTKAVDFEEAGKKLSAKSMAAINTAHDAMHELIDDYHNNVAEADEAGSTAAGTLLAGIVEGLYEAYNWLVASPEINGTALSADVAIPEYAAFIATRDTLGIEPALAVISEDKLVAAGFIEAKLTTKARKALKTEQFADPENKAYPINDKAHADNAAARLEQQKANLTPEKYAAIHAKIVAAQKRHGEAKKPPVKVAETAPTAINATEILPESMNATVQVGAIFSEDDASTPASPKYNMLVIKEGMSGNRVMYKRDVLKDSMHLLENRPIYVDHPAGAREGNTSRSLATKAGWWDQVKYVENMTLPSGSQVSGIVARVNLFSKENSPTPWLPGMIKESLDSGRPDLVGISILAAGKTKISRDNQGPYKEALDIQMYASADAVAEPGAGGQPLSFVASEGVDPDVKTIAEMTIEELREARPDLIEAMKAGAGGSVKTEDPPKADDPGKTVLAEMQSEFATAKTALVEATEALQRDRTSALLEMHLGRTRLPEVVRTKIRERVGTQIMVEDALKGIIDEYEQTAKAVLAESDSPTRLAPGTIIPFGGFAEDAIAPIDQVGLALDHFFGNPDKEKAGKYPRIRSFAEFYANVTGDHDFNGVINPKLSALGDSWFKEALPGATHVVGGATITMSNLLGTAMNKALFNFYMAQDRWWEPIVTKTELQNMKTQTRIRLQNFGSLTQRTTDGAEYTELDWGEVTETYAPTTYGNVVTIGRIAIINDDLKGIQSIPKLLAQTAIITINEYVSNLFTQNSGNGPTLADSVQVFNNASHQGNKVTLTLTRANVITARNVIGKMTNDAGKRIGLLARILLVPQDLEADAYELLNTQKVPDSANNAQNILADPNRGLNRIVVPPQWTNTTRWYMMAPSDQLTSIELGFLFGRDTPELFVQDQPAVGMVFTNDVMSHKIRWDFGADWLDYRGALFSAP